MAIRAFGAPTPIFVRVILSLTLLLFCPLPSAFADEGAAADALFRAGRRALQQGDYMEARARFAESYRLDSAPGTLLNLAIAEDKLGQLSSAWEHARSAILALLPDDTRAPVARELFDSLDVRVPRITLRPSASLPEDTHVFLDGAELRAASFGVPLPVDPGVHHVVVAAPARADHLVTLNVEERAHAEHVLEAGELATMAVAPEERAASPLKWAGYGALSVGAAGLALGAITGGLAIDRSSTVQRLCNSGCNSEGLAAEQSGKTFSTWSTISFIAGGALVIGGVILVAFAPRAGGKPAHARLSAPALTLHF